MTLAKNLATPVAGLLIVALAGCAGAPAAPPPTQAQEVENRRADAQKCYDKAQEYTINEQYDNAIDLYKQCVSLNPKHPLGWYYLGVICNHQRQYAAAVEAWRVAADVAPTDPHPYFALGLQYQDLGFLTDASDCYTRALERDADFLPALKKSVEVDQLKDTYTDVTLKRIRRALLQETDPKWVTFLRMMMLKTEERVARAGGNTGH